MAITYKLYLFRENIYQETWENSASTKKYSIFSDNQENNCLDSLTYNSIILYIFFKSLCLNNLLPRSKQIRTQSSVKRTIIWNKPALLSD